MISYKQGKVMTVLCVNILLLFLTYVIIIFYNFFAEDVTSESVSSVTVEMLPKREETVRSRKEEGKGVLIVGLSENFEEKEDNSERNEINAENLQNLSSMDAIEEEQIAENEIMEKVINDSEQNIIQNKTTEEIPQIVEETTLEIAQTQNIVPAEYNGYSTIGKIQIPATGVDIPILSNVTVKGMENAPCLLYQTGELNKNGNSLIVGHNYRNGTIFSNNQYLDIGDKMYVTTLDGNMLEYTIYNKFVTTAEDTTYIKRDTNNKPEITLSSCTDDDELRIIILAKIAS